MASFSPIIDDLNKQIAELDKKFKKKKKKITMTRKEQQAWRIIELLAQGFPRHKIANKLAEEFEVTEQQIYHAWDRAREILQETESRVDLSELKDIILNRYQEVYYRAMQQNNLTAAQNALKEYAKLSNIDTDRLDSQQMTIRIEKNEDNL